MACRFLSFASILKSGRLSALFRCRPSEISRVEAGSPLTCRKRNMLSGLRCEGRGMGGRARRPATISIVILVTFFGFAGTFFQIPGLYRQANTRPAGHPPSDWPASPQGERREAGRPGPPPFSFVPLNTRIFEKFYAGCIPTVPNRAHDFFTSAAKLSWRLLIQCA